MRNSTYSINFKGLSFGEHEFQFTIGEDLFAAYEECELLSAKGEVAIVLQRSETMLQLDIEIDAEVEVECDRCLDPCAIEIEYQAPLVVKFSDEEELAGEYDGDVMWLGTTASELDLAHYIYESIILSLPYQRVHADGECNPEMMSHFKIVSAEEFTELSGEESEEEGESGYDESVDDEMESEALPASEIEKLQALKRLLEGGE